jgi:hypothetical protein
MRQCVGCILAIPIFAWRSQFGGVVILTILLFVEIAVLIANEWRCPLTNVAARYTDDRSENFDIYLPPWLARNNKLIFGWLFAIILAFALVLWLRVDLALGSGNSRILGPTYSSLADYRPAIRHDLRSECAWPDGLEEVLLISDPPDQS